MIEKGTHLRLVQDDAPDNSGDYTLEEATRTYRSCQHKAVTVDAELRIVTCKKCGEKLDPLQCLINIIREGKNDDRKLAIIQLFEEKEKGKHREQSLRKLRPLVKLVGQVRAESFVWCGGSQLAQTGNMMVDRYEHPATGARVQFTSDGRFWIGSAVGEFTEIPAAEVMAYLNTKNAAP